MGAEEGQKRVESSNITSQCHKKMCISAIASIEYSAYNYVPLHSTHPTHTHTQSLPSEIYH